MEHRTMGDLRQAARVVPLGGSTMSRRDRLERWATLLMQHPEQRLEALRRVEFISGDERARLRGDGTPLAIAYADRVLREEGLASDRFGDAVDFFDLSDRIAHYLLCDCHYEGTMTAARVAERIRSVKDKVTFRELWQRMRGMATRGYRA
jgi:hypothetical protein